MKTLYHDNDTRKILQLVPANYPDGFMKQYRVDDSSPYILQAFALLDTGELAAVYFRGYADFLIIPCGDYELDKQHKSFREFVDENFPEVSCPW